jgi:hypothetical protein
VRSAPITPRLDRAEANLKRTVLGQALIGDDLRAGAGRSGLAENALDIGDCDPADLRHLGSRHAVLHPGPNPGKFRPTDLAR